MVEGFIRVEGSPFKPWAEPLESVEDVVLIVAMKPFEFLGEVGRPGHLLLGS